MSNLYVIGYDPYKFSGKHDTRGNGVWNAEAEDADTALNAIFGTMAFPGEATGRAMFMEGVSLDGVPSEEVIQVWSDNREAMKRLKESQRHNGRGVDLGLLMEIRVTEIVKYTPAGRKLLADPSAPETQRAVSPIGVAASNMAAVRYELHQKLQMTQHAVGRKTLELEEAREGLKEQKKKIEGQLMIMQTYLHGAKQTNWLCRGSRAPANVPYRIFQNRQFINREVALLANLTDLDFDDMESLNRWIVKSGQIWKLLPFDKTILVTRIRDEKKTYGDPITDWILNQFNFQNIIWIRDGENVMQVYVDTDFENAVFPSKQQEDRAFSFVHDKLWRENFATMKEPKYGLKTKAIDEREPCEMRQVTLHRFGELQDWLDSKEYEVVREIINEHVFEHLREKNQERMTFLVLLQGLVDNTNLLTVPAGSDLFRSEVCLKYFELIYDYSHGLPDPIRPAAVAPYLTYVQPGQWIIVEYVVSAEKGSRYSRGYEPMLFHVVKVTPEGKPIVRFRRKVKKSYESSRVSTATSTVVEGPWIRADLPDKLAQDILDDREWKIKHSWVVPLLAQWKTVQRRYLKSPANHLEIDLDKAEA